MKRMWIPLALFLVFQGCYESPLVLSKTLKPLALQSLSGSFRSPDGRYRLESRQSKPEDDTTLLFRMEDVEAGRLFIGSLEAYKVGSHTLLSISGAKEASDELEQQHSQERFAFALLQKPEQWKADTKVKELEVQLLKTQLPEVHSAEALQALLDEQGQEALEPTIQFVRMK